MPDASSRQAVRAVVVVFPAENSRKGELVTVRVTGCTQTTLIGYLEPSLPEETAYA